MPTKKEFIRDFNININEIEEYRQLTNELHAEEFTGKEKERLDYLASNSLRERRIKKEKEKMESILSKREGMYLIESPIARIYFFITEETEEDFVYSIS